MTDILEEIAKFRTMDFGVQMLIALCVTCVICIPICLYKFKKYRKEGKSIKYLGFKVAIVVGLPIASIPILLSDEITILDKAIAIVLMLISGIAYAYRLTSARRSFRKILGLPPEDEDTGEVIKEDKKEK